MKHQSHTTFSSFIQEKQSISGLSHCLNACFLRNRYVHVGWMDNCALRGLLRCYFNVRAPGAHGRFI